MESYPLNYYEGEGFLAPGNFDIGVGAPGSDLLRSLNNYMEKGFANMMKRQRSEENLQYNQFRGGYFFREQLSNLLTRHYGQHVDKNDLFITCGATGGVDFLINSFMDKDRVVFVENPTYKNFAHSVIKEEKVPVKSIEMEKDGMDLVELEKKVSALPEIKLTSLKPFRAMVYVIPVYHNPTGCCYSAEKCRRLVEIARKYKLLIVSDDVYNCLSIEPDPNDPEKFSLPPQRLFAYDSKQDPDYQGNVISNGSFSKIAGPALRLGWFELSELVAMRLEEALLLQSGSGMSAYVSCIMAEVIASGDFDKHLYYSKKVFKERMEGATSLIEERLGKLGGRVSHPSGGVFLWIKLPQGVTAAAVREIALKSKVTFTSGPNASVTGDFENFIRISYACYELPQLLEGVELLCQAVEQVLKQ